MAVSPPTLTRPSSKWSPLLVLGVVVLAGVTAGTGGVLSQSSTSTVSECTTISEPGRYVLEESLTHTGTVGSAACITVTADDVVIDGQGRTFDGRGISNTTGIRVVGAENVTVRNLRLQDWHYGVHYVDSSRGRLQNVTVVTSVYGIGIDRSTDVSVRDSSVRRSFVGVRLEAVTKIDLTNTTVRGVSGVDVHRG